MWIALQTDIPLRKAAVLTSVYDILVTRRQWNRTPCPGQWIDGRPSQVDLTVLRYLLPTCAVLIAVATPADGQDFPADSLEFFEGRVRPLLVQHCYECHSTDAESLKAGLSLDSRDGILRGGDSGPAAVAGQPEQSVLIEAVRYKSFEMPPDRKLSDDEITVLVRWVEMGLPWPNVSTAPGRMQVEQEIDWAEARNSHWAWQAVRRPNVPPVGDFENPIDAFVAERRNRAGLRAVPPAAPQVLARRAFLDLIGILPTPQQVAEFEEASDVDRGAATASLVDSLLASPLYGQRWGRHWLDVARYSDGFGGFLDNSGLDDAWHYRDWVVDAFNQDMPCNRFLELQIAGDLIGDYRNAVATGFFALGPTYRSDGGDPDSIAQARGETLDDRVDTLTRGLLGITGSCARCHDHKFDPIPQKDYYSLAGVFQNTSVRNLTFAPDDVAKAYDAHKAAVEELTRKIRRLKKDDQSTRKAELQKQLAALEANGPAAVDRVHALHDTGSSDMAVALRGNLRREGEVAPRRFLRILEGPAPRLFSDGSGRRELAAAVVNPQNPLTARVFVNRVWLHHFGDGLVRTPDNFGSLGEPPTHPELLDWLASEFVAHGWSIKQLHRLIMTSQTYQLSSQFHQESFAADGDNRLLWRMSPRRMDVESWRDSLLFVTGELDSSANGPSVHDPAASQRRTLYTRVSRNGDHFASDMFLRRFDFPSMRATVGKRPQTVVPQQFLFLLNSPFMRDRAKALVARLNQSADTSDERIALAYQLLFSRLPTDVETAIARDFLASPAENPETEPWQQYAQALLSSNEFMYVR